ncbi:MAG: hypothetical protein ACI9MC_002494 [Kiritimatiellia bacterium]
MGVGEVEFSSEATVKAGGSGTGASEVDCFLPIAIPECYLDKYTEAELGEMVMRLSPAGSDNIGWARVGGSPNARWISDQLGDQCQDGAVRIGDSVGLNNGVIASALTKIDRQIEGSATSWEHSDETPRQFSNSSVSNFGNTLEGPILIVNTNSAYCNSGGGSWTGSVNVSGFAWGVIYDVASKGKAAKKNIGLSIDLSREHRVGTRDGGPDVGVLSNRESGRIVK